MATSIRGSSIRFIHLELFDREWSQLKLDDDALCVLQTAIMAGPDHSPVVSGTGGLRKMRFAEPGSNGGKSGSYQVGYVDFPEYESVALVTVWGKNEKSNLSKADRNAIAAIIRDIKDWLDRGDLL